MNRYRRLSGSEISDALNETGLSARQFARMADVNETRLMRALRDDPGSELPHAACLLLALLCRPGVRETVDAYNAHMREETAA